MKNCIFLAYFLLFAAIVTAQNPQTYKIGYKEKGHLSYYPGDEDKRKTLSGEVYDMAAMEAAHKYLPFGTLLKVTNLENDKEVILRVNDRPNTTERIMDVTLAVADSLGLVKEEKATAFVAAEIIALGVPRNNNQRQFLATAPSPTKVNKSDKKEIKKEPNKEVVKNNVSKNVKTKEKSSATTDKVVKSKDKVEVKSLASKKDKGTLAANPKTTTKELFDDVGCYDLVGKKQNPEGYGIQIGLFTEAKRASSAAKALEVMKMGKVYIQTIEKDSKKSYKVLVGSFKEKDATKELVKKLTEKKYTPFVKKYSE